MLIPCALFVRIFEPINTAMPFALFSLVPSNERAREVVAHPRNGYLKSTLPDGRQALDVGLNIRSRSSYTLATLGRNADIVIEGSSISRVQCSFEIQPESRRIMLFDHSNSQTTQCFGDDAIPFD